MYQRLRFSPSPQNKTFSTPTSQNALNRGETTTGHNAHNRTCANKRYFLYADHAFLYLILCRSLAQYIRTRPTHHGISGGSFLALERVITLVTVGTGCVLTGLLLLVNWGDPGWWRHGIVCSLPHSSPFSKRHPTQRGQQFQNFPAHFLPPPTKIASDHTKFSYSPVREPQYK